MSGNIDRFFRSPQGPGNSRPSGRLWSPAADVYHTDDGWIVKVDLAGIQPQDVEITISGPMLHITGLRRDSFCGEGVSHYQLEITYSRFQKTIQFPSSIEHAAIVRDYRDGLLILRLREAEDRAGESRKQARSAGR